MAKNSIKVRFDANFFFYRQDFRNFTYSLPIIRGLFIHMEDKVTTIVIPKNRYAIGSGK